MDLPYLSHLNATLIHYVDDHEAHVRLNDKKLACNTQAVIADPLLVPLLIKLIKRIIYIQCQME